MYLFHDIVKQEHIITKKKSLKYRIKQRFHLSNNRSVTFSIKKTGLINTSEG